MKENMTGDSDRGWENQRMTHRRKILLVNINGIR